MLPFISVLLLYKLSAPCEVDRAILFTFLLLISISPVLLSDTGPRGLEVRGHGARSAFLVDFHHGRSTGHGSHYPPSAHFV